TRFAASPKPQAAGTQPLVDTPHGSQPGDSQATYGAFACVDASRGLPSPTVVLAQRQNVQRGVVVPVQAQATILIGAAMPPDGQAFRDLTLAAGTFLAGIGGFDRNRSLPGARCLESEDGEES